MLVSYSKDVMHTVLALQTVLVGYIDPGSGSYYFQMLIAGLTTVCFFFATIKRKILSLFKKTGPPASAPAAGARLPVAGQSKDQSVPK